MLPISILAYEEYSVRLKKIVKIFQSSLMKENNIKRRQDLILETFCPHGQRRCKYLLY